MDWLGGWLKSIILIILVATFVDILLPNQTMQRYVKTVLSLFILLTLLQPLFSLFERNATVDKLLADADSLFSKNAGSNTLQLNNRPGGAVTMQPLSDIDRQAEQLKARQAEQSEQLVRQQISDLMKRSLEQSTDIKVVRVNVETAKDASGQMQISQVNVQAAAPPGSPVAKGEPDSAVKGVTVEPVKPVHISVEPKTEAVFGSKREQSAQTPDKNSDNPARKEAGAADEQRQTQIKLILNRDWQVPMDQITVEVAAADGKDKF